MLVEERKFYRTRDGRQVGPMRKSEPWCDYLFTADGFNPKQWYSTGKCSVGSESPLDLIAEWLDEGPVRTRTVVEIVPGIYGRFKVAAENYSGQHESNGVGLRLIQRDGITETFNAALNVHELRAAATLFAALADALEGGK